MFFNVPFGQITNPDLGFQLSVCVSRIGEQAMMQAIRAGLFSPVQVGGRSVVPVAPNTPLDIRAMCSSNTERFGLWFPGSPLAGRDDALRLPSRLLPGENYVQQISLNGMRFLANNVWNDPATPKRINMPDPLPAAQLNGFFINLVPPNQIVTIVTGVLPIAILPDVRFTVTLTDTVSLDSQGRVLCTPSRPEVRATSNPFGALLSPALTEIARSAIGSRQMEGLGCQVLRAMAPGGVTVPGCGRIAFPYTRLDMDGAGVVLGSRAPLADCILRVRVQEEPFRAPR